LLIDASQMLIAPAAVLVAGNQGLLITAAGSVVHAFDQEKGLFYLLEISCKENRITRI